jgi:hypothetical protein
VRVKHYHVPQRFRSRWRNLHRMRLYLYFKHRAGDDFVWSRFLRDEAALVARELRALRHGRPRRDPLRVALWFAVETWKILATRLMIPRIHAQATR